MLRKSHKESATHKNESKSEQTRAKMSISIIKRNRGGFLKFYKICQNKKKKVNYIRLKKEKGVFKILTSIKKIFVHLRSSLKFVLILLIPALAIIGIISAFYKPTYSVTIDGEFIGYTDDKNGLQQTINEYIESGDAQNVAFIDIQTLPEYSLCFVKREQVEDTNQILEKIKASGTTYYEYYAIVEEDEEKYYVSTKEEAEAAINQLKEKDSNNIDDISYTQKYGTELVAFSDQDTIVAGLYEKKPVYYSSGSTGSYTVASAKIDLAQYGVTLVQPITSGYTITSRFGTRRSGNHSGLDIAAPTGTVYRAAAGGTVTFAGWSTTGYGYCIKISHGNGVETLYAHSSQLYVSVGQTVAQGEAIGAVGSTGLSTGPHLHFEVRVNGAVYNPQYYLYSGQ